MKRPLVIISTHKKAWQLALHNQQPLAEKDRQAFEQLHKFEAVELKNGKLLLTPRNTTQYDLFDAFLSVYIKFDLKSNEESLRNLIEKARQWMSELRQGF